MPTLVELTQKRLVGTAVPKTGSSAFSNLVQQRLSGIKKTNPDFNLGLNVGGMQSSTPQVTEFGTEDVLKAVGQGIARTYVATAQFLTERLKGKPIKEALETPFIPEPTTTKFGRFTQAILGTDQPVSLKSEDIVFLGKKLGEISSGRITFGLTLLDLYGGGGLKGLKGLTKAIQKTEDVGEITKFMKSAGFADDIIENYAPTFAKIDDAKKVEEGLLRAERVQNTTKKLAEGVGITPKKPTAREIKFGLAEKPTTITRTESTLLKNRLQAEAMSSKETAKATSKVTKGIERTFAQERLSKALRTQELSGFKKIIKERFYYEKSLDELSGVLKKSVETLKNKAINIAEKKQIITDYVKDKLPLSLRGALITSVNRATTDGDVAKAIRRINIIRNNEIKTELVSSIETALEKIDALPVKQQQKALEAIEGLTASSFSKKTQQKLIEIKEFLTKEPEEVYKFGAKNVKRVEKIPELGKVNFADAPIRNIIKINDRLEHLLSQGDLYGKTVKETKQLRVENAVDNIVRSKPRNLNEGLPPTRKPGEPVSTGKFEGAKSSTIEGMRKGVQYYASPDVGFQILDNDKWFGQNWKTFKRPMDVAQDAENTFRNSKIDNLFDGLKSIESRHGKLSNESYEKVMIYATLKQVGGRAKLQKSDAKLFTDTFLDGIKLNEGEMEFYKLGRSIFDELRPDIERVMWTTRGEKLGKVDNYWSWMTDFDNSDEIFQRIAGDYSLRTRTEQGFTKARIGGKQKINLNALDVLSKHINDAFAFIHKEELLNHLSKIAQSPKYSEAVGKMGQKWVAGWLDLIARGGIPKGYKPGILTKLVRNLGHGVLGFRVSPIVKQPLAKIVSTGFLGVDTFKYDPQFFTDFGIREAVHNISAQQKFRNFDDPAYTALAKSKRLAKWQEWGYKGIKTFDSWTSDSVWYAAYRHNLNDRGLDFSFSLDEFKVGENIDNKAKEYADLIVRRTQGSSEYKDAPLMYALENNKDFVMAFLQFQRFIQNQSLLWRDVKVALIKEKDPIKALAISSSLIAAGIAESYVTSGMAQIFSSEDYAKKEAEKEIGDRVLNVVTGQIPFISNLTSMAEFGGTGVPVWDVAKQGYQGAVSAYSGKKKETKLKGATRAVEAGVSLAGISGAGQVGQIPRKFIPKEKKGFPKLPAFPKLKLPALPKL